MMTPQEQYQPLALLMRARRKKLDLTLADVAATIGIHATHLSRMETANWIPSPEYVQDLLGLYWPGKDVMHLVLMLSAGILDSETIRQRCTEPNFAAALAAILLDNGVARAVLDITPNDENGYGYAAQYDRGDLDYLIGIEESYAESQA